MIGLSNLPYSFRYDDVSRFIAYHHQIQSILSCNPENILEVGVGNNTVTNYLRDNGFKVTTVDIDPSTKPDFIGDVRSLPFINSSFDVVLASHILEHIPFKDLETSLKEISRVSRGFAVIGLPYQSVKFECVLKFPFIRHLFKREYVSVSLRIPLWRGGLSSPEHLWELGRWEYPLHRIRRVIEKYFYIVSESSPVLNQTHYSFILNQKKMENNDD